ncbi:GntR family transcriptional regulator [Sulfoacidibacillus thermotolerans]|uniref:GntR family transcriptional regulator n=1 Tax=Sulfoacidibacillus thermotolerans TaxID=1765684 RepID=A0A2U3DCA9_SULT2|nr:GntR family transcriptional regulator [Sulfoacidibacillus thermotolerans]PWI58920.1 GntR family transcriptional regulator [Sulfoacidibacillus thermotolerans]
MNRSIIRKNGIPLYVQVKERILSDIRTGVYQSGDKLPTERELSAMIGVSRNTISQAYHELEREGVIASAQGRGTFVCDRDDKVRFGNRRDLLQKVIDVALEECLQLGFTLDDFMQFAAVRVKEKAALLDQSQIVFIECNREQVEYFSRKLEFGGVHITPVIIDELRDQKRDALLLVESADLIITTFFHFDEVQQLLGEMQTILAIALDPELETIVKIARIPEQSEVGLVCRSDRFAGKVRSALRQAGLDGFTLHVSTTSDPDELARFVKGLHAVIVSPSRRREVEKACTDRQPIIEFVFRPDAASVNLLRAAVADVRRER